MRNLKNRIGIIIALQIFCIIILLLKDVSKYALLIWPVFTLVETIAVLLDIRKMK